jgi:hypothetical protein
MISSNSDTSLLTVAILAIVVAAQSLVLVLTPTTQQVHRVRVLLSAKTRKIDVVYLLAVLTQLQRQ